MAQRAIQAIDEGMVGSILVIGEDEQVVDDIDTAQRVLLLRNQFLPIRGLWMSATMMRPLGAP